MSFLESGNIAGNSINKGWIWKPWFDSIFILLPPIFTLLLVVLLPGYFNEQHEVTVIQWVILVMFIDVAHVYSTLYRTYFDKKVFTSRKSLLIYTPLVSWLAGIMVYEINAMLFWRILAYLAVYHFIRQQYGFMRIYSRTEQSDKFSKLSDKGVIYAATLYPVLYWHLKGDRKFSWFTEGDFILFKGSDLILNIFTILYFAIVFVYIGKEVYFSIRYNRFNLAKNLVIAGTLFSWYAGIIYFNGDLTFTLLNVVSHGVPYMALVWATCRKESENGTKKPLWSFLFSPSGILLFAGIILLLAYMEEAAWDSLVWQDHQSVFGLFYFFESVPADILVFIVPLLSVPQITHYVLDGIIWKNSGQKAETSYVIQQI